MKCKIHLHLLTFVVVPSFLLFFIFISTGHSTPQDPPSLEVTPPRQVLPESNPEAPTEPDQPHQLDQYNLMPYFSAPPPPLQQTSPPPNNFYFPYRQSLGARLGLVYSTEKETTWEYLMGFTYLWPKFASPQAEMGADVIPSIGGHLNFGIKHIYLERSYFRPFLIWGLTHEARAHDGLATLAQINNYYLRGSVGLEDVITLPMSVRLEIEILAGLKKQMAILAFGYSWAW